VGDPLELHSDWDQLAHTNEGLQVLLLAIFTF
jgi:hypothetical protein